ncbi:hypothetical protein DN748_12890 [Sinomicrobium soli]|nr:hypothetical protein DN748_12890 [Sinomicrobium sp. N-1-3-6]
MNRIFKNIGVLMIKADNAFNGLVRTIRHFFRTNLFAIFFIALFCAFTFVEVTYLLDDAYDTTDRIIATVLYFIFLVVATTALYFFFKRKRIKNVNGNWEVINFEEITDKEMTPETKNTPEPSIFITAPPHTSIKLKLRPQGHHGKEGVGQKDMVNYLNDYYNHQYENEIRYFVYMHFETEKKHQRLRKIKGPFEAPPIDDKTNFIELFWVLCKEEIITNSFSDVSTFLNTIYPWLGNSIEKIPSENKFSEHYRNTPNIRAFLDRIKRK